MSKRIALISEDLAAPWDEGIKNFAYGLGRALAEENELAMFNVDRGDVGATDGIVQLPGTRTFLSTSMRRELRGFAPDMTVYVPSPSATMSSFGRSYVLRRHLPGSAIGMVALIPRRHALSLRSILEATSPDIVFVPSYLSLLHLSDLGVAGALTAVGVDRKTFRLPQPGEKADLRQKHGIPQDTHVYLHVGHIRPKRNLAMLKGLVEQPAARVVVVGSTSTSEDVAVRAELEAAGVDVVRKYVPVHEYYRLADTYVFPVIDHEGCVEIPLSVVEALSCGLPVLSRPFGGLRDFLAEGDDLIYWDTEDQLRAGARALRETGSPRVRDMEEFSWQNIARKIQTALEARIVETHSVA